ncbi:MAG: hypothetical protein KAS49_02955 [Candidatus Cloacimonetes bacterium]|nr:hypothetical protein [Candidatus Cloacimonadota bacterium]
MKKFIILLIVILPLFLRAESSPSFLAKVGNYRTLYLKNDNIFYGEILKINDDGSIQIETEEGLLTIPNNEILEETLKVKKNNGTSFSGKLLGENEVYIEIQTDYGSVTVNKGDIKDLHRYFGGKREKTVQQKIFFAGEEQITDLFGDPTAFVLPPYAFYISGFSMGYGFSNRFHMYTKITNNLSEDLNLSSRYVLFKKNYGAKKVNFATQLNIYSNHDMNKEYGKYYDEYDVPGLSDKEVLDNLYGKNNREFYWNASFIYSLRSPLRSGRGNWGFHSGITFDQLLTKKPEKQLTYGGETYDFKGGFTDTHFDSYRVFAGFDYDLSKRIKFISIVYYDPGNHYQTFGESVKNYFENSFVQDGHVGERKAVDFDFGVTFTPNETLRIGFHFQNPFITVYWKFLDY